MASHPEFSGNARAGGGPVSSVFIGVISMDQPIVTTDLSTTPGERIIDKPELPPGGTISFQWAETEWDGEGQLKVGRKEISR
jgi:hypothetical protein